MKKVQIHEFDPVIYPYKFWICISNNTKPLLERFTTIEGNELDFSDDYAATTHEVVEKEAYNTEGKRRSGVVIIFKTKANCKTKFIAHESSHAAKALFEYIGADIQPHEPFEYLLGWIADCCEQVRKFKPVQSNKTINDNE